MLLGVIQSGEPPAPRKVMLETTLIVRGSSVRHGKA
jgi:hypothetical protein